MGSIDNFDQLYYIQQGGRGVTQQQIINRLRNAIKSDITGVYNTNVKLWNNIEVGGIKISNSSLFKDFVDSKYFEDLLKNSILTTE